MGDVRNKEDLGSVGGGAADGAKPRDALPGTTVRKRYQQPRLRYLGSVRELTAGSATPAASDGNGFKPG
jgi:hypothetical protein